MNNIKNQLRAAKSSPACGFKEVFVITSTPGSLQMRMGDSMSYRLEETVWSSFVEFLDLAESVKSAAKE